MTGPETTTMSAATVIKGGVVFDGTGADGRLADVLIRDGRVERIARGIEVDGASVIDAEGCWITPGFIDLHTHYDAELELDPALIESVRHGVTTVLVGSCGLSFAVGEPEDLADMFCRVEGVPRAEVLPMLRRIQDWDSPAGYFDHLDRLPLGPNVCSFLGHSAIRAHVMGLARSVDSAAVPSAAELDRMATMVDEALDVGYLGLSINTLPWDKMDGERFRSRPTPSVFASWKEYRHLSKVLRRRDAILEAVPDISTRWNLVLFALMASGVGRKPLKTTIISLLDTKAVPGAYKVFGGAMLTFRRLIRADVRLQALPQPFRMWTDGLENPVIEEIGAGTEALHLAGRARTDLLQDPEYRTKFRRQWSNKIKGRAYHRDLAEAVIVGCPDASLEGKSFAEVASERGADRITTFLDLQAEFGNDLRWYTVVGNDRLKELEYVVTHPTVLIGFSDAGAHLRNMAYYDFPLHLLRLVVNAEAEGRTLMTREQAVHRVTGEIADYLGIDAGHLEVGRRADLVVVDPSTLDGRLDEITEEEMVGMPGLDRLVRRHDDCVPAVLVNGRITWRDGAFAEGFGDQRGFGRVLRANP